MEPYKRLGNEWKCPPRWYFFLVGAFFLALLCSTMECEGDACAKEAASSSDRQVVEAIVSISKSLEEQTREMKRQTKALKDLSTKVKGVCKSNGR
jgi:hypothetical protein